MNKARTETPRRRKSFADWLAHLYDDDGKTPLRETLGCAAVKPSCEKSTAYRKMGDYVPKSKRDNLVGGVVRNGRIEMRTRWSRIATGVAFAIAAAVSPFAANAAVLDYPVEDVYLRYVFGNRSIVVDVDGDWLSANGSLAHLSVKFVSATSGKYHTEHIYADDTNTLHIPLSAVADAQEDGHLYWDGFTCDFIVDVSDYERTYERIYFRRDGSWNTDRGVWNAPTLLPNAVNLTMDGSTVRVRLTGAELCTFQVQTSADLREWQTIHDAVDSPSPARFFRVVVLDDPSSPQYGADLADAENSHSLDRRKGNISVEFEIDADAPISLLATPDNEIYTLHADKYYCNYYRIYAD